MKDCADTGLQIQAVTLQRVLLKMIKYGEQSHNYYFLSILSAVPLFVPQYKLQSITDFISFSDPKIWASIP